MERLFWAAGVVTLVTALSAPLPAQGVPTDLVVVATTDVHGRLRGWDYYADTAERGRGLTRAATIVDSVRAANPGRVLLLDAGDLLQGNPLTYAAARVDTTGPHPVIAVMNAMRYDAAAIGNHEFNYGLGTLTRAFSEARFPFLSSNGRWLQGGSPWKSWTMVDRAGMKVALVGATTPGVMVWDRENVRGRVEFGDIVAGVQRAAHEAREAGADVVVVVAHSGLTGDDSYDRATTGLGAENAMAAVAHAVPEVDLIVFGHSHRELADTLINGVLLTQPRNWAGSVAVAHLRYELRGSEWRPIGKSASIVRVMGHDEAPAIVSAAEPGHRAARAYASRVVGTTATVWRADSSRLRATPIMALVLETMRRAAHADLASAAAFDLGVRIGPGPVTVAQLAQLYPYDNTLRAVRISGAALRAYLEHSARYYTSANGVVAPDPAIPGYNFEMVSGADYTIDVSRPVGRRITRLLVRGRPVRDADQFTLALTNYRAGGAGGYTMVAGLPVVHDAQLEIRQLLIDEVARRGTIAPRDYFRANWSLRGTVPSRRQPPSPR
jgi:2',3'-cyclic-nucleotide 2'-phosphodiesterase/3'-nucleotidase